MISIYILKNGRDGARWGSSVMGWLEMTGGSGAITRNMVDAPEPVISYYCYQHFLLFPRYFLLFSATVSTLLQIFNLSSSNAYNLDET